jgi:simple sugar transport system ATP-binding protein
VLEVDRVLELIQGIAVVLISQRLTDVFAVSDRIIALRPGQGIADEPTAQTSMNAVVAHIVGAG